MDCRTGLPGCSAMEDYPRVSLAPEFRIGSSREFRVPGALSLIVPGPQSLVHILLASAAIAVAIEATSANLASCHCRNQRCSLCSRCLLWRFPRHYWPGSVQHRGTASVRLCRGPAVHGGEQRDVSGTRSNPTTRSGVRPKGRVSSISNLRHDTVENCYVFSGGESAYA